MSFTVVQPITPGLMGHFGLSSDAGIGLVASSFALGRFCTTSLWPLASDYAGRKPVLCAALLGGAIGSALQGAAITLGWPFAAFLAVRGLAGMFSGIVPVVKAYIVDSFSSDEVPKVLAYREAAGTCAFIVGPLIGGVLATRMFASPLFFSAITSTLAALLVAKSLPREAPAAERRAARAEAAAARQRAKSARSSSSGDSGARDSSPLLVAAPLLLFSFIWASLRTCFHAYFPLLLARRFFLDAARMGGVLTIISLFVASVQVAGFEPCRKRLGLEQTMALGFLLACFGILGIASSGGSSMAVVILFAAAYGAGTALLSPALPALLVRAAPDGRCGALLGIESAIVNFGRIVAPPIFGLLYQGAQAEGHGWVEVGSALALTVNAAATTATTTGTTTRTTTTIHTGTCGRELCVGCGLGCHGCRRHSCCCCCWW
ncbi:unnamed protein product [Polarella glacialis]|uniref:Major facilitator superfamily (MFS) profile domain-containing protein n=1 Tax=Polarella glacialis TaxID=89957 RepID=A0A813H7W7_POLGL|nr:unnamed protein product [Polarella glacialis]